MESNTDTVTEAGAANGPGAGTQGVRSTFDSILQWTMNNWVWIVAVVIGIAVLVILFILFKRMRRKRADLKRSKELSDDLMVRQQLAELAKGGKEGEAAEKDLLAADIQEIRTIIDAGSEKFDSKSLYSNPWYLLIGEPGAGKTEIMRQSNLNFPAHATDMEQGRGGTKSLHWWISNHGTVIDVAGSVLFSRWGAKGNTKWRYLLSRLQGRRKTCPINGIILTIPADSLLADSEKLILKKARMLSEELHTTLKMFSLSLPVYIVITKMDMLCGFNQFCSNLKEDMRFQPLGFTINDPHFNGEEIDGKFAQLKETLKKRRELHFASAELWESAHDPELYGESAESLYGLPESFEQLNVPLKNYLRTLFSGTKLFSMADLSLRGVFFTAALEGGSIIDLSLPRLTDSSIEESEYTYANQSVETGYFIRDLFTEKVFKEGGLVHYSKAAAARRRRVPLLSTLALFAVSLYLIVFTQHKAGHLKTVAKQAIEESDNAADTAALGWDKIRHMYLGGQLGKDPYYLTLMKKDSSLAKKGGERDPSRTNPTFWQPRLGAKSEDFADLHLSKEMFLSMVRQKAEERLEIPLRFRMLSLIRDHSWNDLLKDERQAAFEKVYLTMVAKPLVDYARKSLQRQRPQRWTEMDTAVLNELLLIEMSENKYFPTLPLFFDYALKAEVDSREYTTSRHAFASQCASISGKHPDFARVFAVDPAGKRFFQYSLSSAIEAFCEQSERLDSFPDSDLSAVTEMSALLKAMADLRSENGEVLKRVNSGKTLSLADAAKAEGQLKAGLQKQLNYLKRFDALKQKINLDKNTSLDLLVDHAGEQYLQLISSNYQKIIAALPENPNPVVEDESLASVRSVVVESQHSCKSKLEERLSALKKSFESYGEVLWYYDSDESLQDDSKSLITLYQHVLSAFSCSMKSSNLLRFYEELAELQKSFAHVRSGVKELQSDKDFSKRQGKAVAVGGDAITFAERMSQSRSIKNVLTDFPDKASDIEQTIAGMKSKTVAISVRNLSLGTKTENVTVHKAYAPEHAKRLGSLWGKLGESLKTDDALMALFKCIPYDADLLRTQYGELNKVMTAYENRYVKYWSQYVPGLATVPRCDGWATFYAKIKDQRAFLINQDLLFLYETIQNALNGYPVQEKPLAESTKAFLETLDARIKGMTDTYTKAAEASLAAWNSLPSDGRQASAALNALDDKKLKTTYFLIYNGQDPDNWWSQFVEQATDCIGRDVEREVKKAVAALTNSYMTFPLCNTRQRAKVLTPEQVGSAVKEIEKLTSGVDSAKPAQPKSTFDALCRKLKPEYVFKRDVDRVWVKQIHSVGQLLNPDSKPVTWSLALCGAVAQEKELPKTTKPGEPKTTAAYRRFRFMEVYAGGEKLGQRVPSVSLDGACQVLDSVAGKLSLQDLELRFYMKADAKTPKATLKVAGAWAPLNLYLTPGTVKDKEKNVILIPLSFMDDAGYHCRYWLGMSFDGSLPDSSQWPTRNNWIDYNKAFKAKE